MKTRSSIAVLLLSLAVAATAGTAYAAQATDQAAKYAEMEKCFREHGKLMGKPALTNIHDCWRAHAYLYRMNR